MGEGVVVVVVVMVVVVATWRLRYQKWQGIPVAIGA
jgi:hypothetical protein